MTYAGLTTADKTALLDAKARGAEWVARDEFMGEINGFIGMPRRERADEYWLQPTGTSWNQTIPIDKENLQFVQWENPEPVNIDLALAQIAEMEKAQKPMTVGDKVVELWATDKRAFAARFVITRNTYGFKTYYALHGQLNRTKHGEIEHDNVEDAIQDELDFLNSPYTEGETK